MKIGILTYHMVPNFGAQLQTLSTVNFIRKKGHEPIVLNWYPKDLEDLYASYVPKEQIEIQRNFAKEHFPLSALCREEDELVQEIDRQELNAIILGSDALFKYIPIKRRRIVQMGRFRPHVIPIKVYSVEKLRKNPFFGGFVSKLKRRIPVFAYAVSSENCHYDYMTCLEKIMMKRQLTNLSFISVRDDWTKGMIENIMHTSDIPVVPDPVFGINYNACDFISSKEEIMNKYGITSKYILLSFSQNRCPMEYISSLVKEVRSVGYCPVLLPLPHEELYIADAHTIKLPLSPLDWYALIKYSSGYIGERMHPIVVSLHNAVPCYAFDQYGISKSLERQKYPRPILYRRESSKIYHIMQLAGQEENITPITNVADFPSSNRVIQRILNFDIKRCKLFADKQYAIYQDVMNRIISMLENSQTEQFKK